MSKTTIVKQSCSVVVAFALLSTTVNAQDFGLSNTQTAQMLLTWKLVRVLELTPEDLVYASGHRFIWVVGEYEIRTDMPHWAYQLAYPEPQLFIYPSGFNDRVDTPPTGWFYRPSSECLPPKSVRNKVLRLLKQQGGTDR